MNPSQTSENPPFSQFAQYLCTSHLDSSSNINNHALAARQERIEAPNLSITENMNFYYNDSLVNNGSVVLPSRIIQPAVGKKDKHSKIVTARGPRDRRVRLSIDVAKRFFGLQDMLGFDKASKTLDWLLTKSKSAIEEQAQKHIKPIGQAEKCATARELMRAMARARARERTARKKLWGAFIHKQSLSLISNCTTSTTIKVDLEMDRQFCYHEELSRHMNNVIIPPKEATYHGLGNMLLPCTFDLSSLEGKHEY